MRCDVPLSNHVLKESLQKAKDTSLTVQCFGVKKEQFYVVDSTLVEKRRESISVVESSTLTTEAFVSMFFRLQRPVLITGNMTDKFGLWKYLSNMSIFFERYGDISVKVILYLMIEKSPIKI